MLIIDRKTFLSLPAGILYAKYRSLGCWGHLAIKEESTDFNDWFYYDLLNGCEGCDDSNEFFDKVSKAEEGKTELRNDFDCSARDGLFEDEQLFVVYDKVDIQQLVSKLNELIGSEK